MSAWVSNVGSVYSALGCLALVHLKFKDVILRPGDYVASSNVGSCLLFEEV